jgi:hypothetical protein
MKIRYLLNKRRKAGLKFRCRRKFEPTPLLFLEVTKFVLILTANARNTIIFRVKEVCGWQKLILVKLDWNSVINLKMTGCLLLFSI